MAYIKSLVCEGFKSFKEKTKINFHKGFTSIVGANGSGKSNILDAFVFALGELSGNKMRVNNIRDLICNGGTNGAKPSKWARVDVIFDNSDRTIPVDSNTVKISRKINLKGQGKYYVNDKTTTRRELQDIMDIAGLIPNSSNLILQGELFRIINMNHTERRELIEEISGIASYNEKKEKAEKDLAKVEENISRITLILNEVSIQLDSLEKERDDALKYQELSERQAHAEKSLIIQKIRSFESQLEQISQKKDRLNQQIQEITQEIQQKRENLMQITTKLDKVKSQIKELQTEELEELTQQLNEFKTQLTKKETLKENDQKELAKAKKKLITLFQKRDSLEEKSTQINTDLKKKNETKSEIKAKLTSLKEELYHSEEQIKEFDAEYSKIQAQLKEQQTEISQEKDKNNAIESDMRVLENKVENATHNLHSRRSKVAKIKKQIQTLEEKIEALKEKERAFSGEGEGTINFEALEQEKREINQKLKHLRESIDRTHEKLISLRSKIKAVKSFSSSRGVDSLISLKNNPEDLHKNEIRGKIYGTVAQLGKSKEEYNTALQVAGGGKFNYVVVDNQQTAKECIVYLKNNKLGRASFIPLDKIKTYPLNHTIPPTDHVIGRAVDLIEFDPLFTRAFEFVFGRTVVVADIETATTLKINAKKVTLDGDVVESSNLMRGGKYKKKSSLGFGSVEEAKIPLLEKEIELLKDQEHKYVSRLKEIEQTVTANYKKRISANNEISQIRQQLAVAEDQLKQKRTDLSQLKQEMDGIKANIQELTQELDEIRLNQDHIQQILSTLIGKKEELQEKLVCLQDNDFTKQIESLRQEIEALEKKKMKLDLEITKLETQLEEIRTNQQTELNQSLQETEESIASLTHVLEQTEGEIETLTQQIVELEQQVKEKNQVIGKFYEQKEALLTEQTDLKVKIEDLKSEIHPKHIKINTLDINKNNIESQKQDLKATLEMDDQLLKELEPFVEYSQAKLTEIIEQCKFTKVQLEPVNMRAIKKYDKMERRYEDLIEKHETVVDERLAILNFIDKIEEEKRNTFMNTFNGINEHFRNIFSKLSPGGEAKLELENQEDPFAGGVKMLARPGGKKWCLTQSMSGGEKTLTVIALVLGIQIYVPSPYYILDEIDAALDDYNATQVATMIRELSEDSQFILITHRDVTMTKTDQLLGVSNIHGLTSVINLNIQEALEQIAQF